MTKRAKNKVTVLGSGTSTGIPLVACECEVCKSQNPMDNRLRSSLLLSTKHGQSIIVDTGPDLRQQLLKHQVQQVHGAILTHEHADHIHGIDDLRPYCYKNNSSIPLYTNQQTKKELTERFPYIFKAHELFTEDRPVIGGGIPKLHLQEVSLGKPFSIAQDDFIFFEVPHGYTKSLCFIHNKFGYIIDCESIPDHITHVFKQHKLELLIIDCLQWKPLKNRLTHLTLEQSLKYIDRIGPKAAGLTHLSHHFGHRQLEAHLSSLGKKNVFVTYDGLELIY